VQKGRKRHVWVQGVGSSMYGFDASLAPAFMSWQPFVTFVTYAVMWSRLVLPAMWSRSVQHRCKDVCKHCRTAQYSTHEEPPTLFWCTCRPLALFMSSISYATLCCMAQWLQTVSTRSPTLFSYIPEHSNCPSPAFSLSFIEGTSLPVVDPRHNVRTNAPVLHIAIICSHRATWQK
jgi:hypothetical protein